MKIVLRLLLVISFFLGSWLALAQVNWMTILGVKELKDNTEEKLSEYVKEQIEQTEEVLKDKEIKQTIDSIFRTITKANGIDADEINIMIVENSQVNAYALPTDYMVINSGLIKLCESPEALAGVMAHELSHIQLNHVQRKLIKELGVAVLVSSTSGGGGTVIREVTKTLSSTAYDRSLEEEADEQAVNYMLKADIDPEPLAEFFYQLSLTEPDFISNMDWVSTHTNSKERSKVIVERLENEKYAKRPMIHSSTWSKLKQKLAGLED